jgi:hypothetical protein
MLEGGGEQNLISGEVGKFCKSQYNGWGHEGPHIACKIKQIRLQLSVPLLKTESTVHACIYCISRLQKT